jgi:hypothetical protein
MSEIEMLRQQSVDSEIHSVIKAAFLLPSEVKKKTAGRKTPSRFRRNVLQQLPKCCNSPNEAISAFPYSTSSRKTKSRSLPPCRGSSRSRCQWLAHKNTGFPG